MNAQITRTDYSYPVKSPSIDRFTAHHLPSTSKLDLQMTTQNCFAKRELTLQTPEQLLKSRDQKIDKLQKQLALSESKCQYLKKDNQLLQNQITFLNEHISHLSLARKCSQNSFKGHLQQISFVFMLEITKAQQKFFDGLTRLQQQYEHIQRQLINIKTKTKDYYPSDNKSLCRDRDSIDTINVRLENDKLKIRVGLLENQVHQLGRKYVASFEWKSFQLPNFGLQSKSDCSYESQQKQNRVAHMMQSCKLRLNKL